MRNRYGRFKLKISRRDSSWRVGFDTEYAPKRTKDYFRCSACKAAANISDFGRRFISWRCVMILLAISCVLHRKHVFSRRRKLYAINSRMYFILYRNKCIIIVYEYFRIWFLRLQPVSSPWFMLQNLLRSLGQEAAVTTWSQRCWFLFWEGTFRLLHSSNTIFANNRRWYK